MRRLWTASMPASGASPMAVADDRDTLAERGEKGVRREGRGAKRERGKILVVESLKGVVDLVVFRRCEVRERERDRDRDIGI